MASVAGPCCWRLPCVQVHPPLPLSLPKPHLDVRQLVALQALEVGAAALAVAVQALHGVIVGAAGRRLG